MTKHKKIITQRDKGFVQGYIAACSTIIFNRGDMVEVRDAVEAIYSSRKDLRNHGVEEYDMNILEDVFKEIGRRKKHEKLN